MIGSSNHETNFWHKSLLTNTQVSKIRKASANGSSAKIKFSKKQFSKIVPSGRFESNFLDLISPYKNLLFRPDKLFKKFFNEADKLSKNLTINDMIKTANDSKIFINTLKNTSDKVWEQE